MGNGSRYKHTHYAIAFIVDSIYVFSHLRLKSGIKFTTRLPLPQSLVHIINHGIQRENATYLPPQSTVTCAQNQRQKHYTNLKHQQSIAHKINFEILKGKYYKISVLLQQITFEIIDKIYFLREPKKSASEVALLQNQL